MLVSDLKFFGTSQTPPDNLICPAVELFNAAKFATDAKAIIESSDRGNRRNAFVALLKDVQNAGRKKIAERFKERPFEARPTTRSYAYLTDVIVTSTFRFAHDILQESPSDN